MKNKDVVVVSVVVLVGLLGAGGFWLRPHQKVALNDGAASINADAAPANAGNSASTAGGLNVAPSSGAAASSLGQLGGAAPAGGQGTPASGAAGSGATASPVDPSTFAQYDKYKDNSTALFGDIQAGTGATLSANQQATIIYKGWLTDGTLFDQSRTDSSGRLQPLVFTLGAHQVIPGMEEGVMGMKVGGSRLIIIPRSLGYGGEAQGAIPPNSVLVFEVQLLAAQ